MRTLRAPLLTLVCIAIPMSLFGFGCTKSAPPVQASAQRMEEIVKKSGGEWNNVAASDQEYIIKELANGSEKSAQMLFLARWGRMKGGPPNPGGVR